MNEQVSIYQSVYDILTQKVIETQDIYTKYYYQNSMSNLFLSSNKIRLIFKKIKTRRLNKKLDDK